MKLLPVLCLLLVVVVGCGRIGGGTGTNGSNAEASPTPVAKLFDMPSLIGKSHEEINKILGQDVKLSVGTATYKFPRGSLHVSYSQGKKAVGLSFTHDTIDLGQGQSSSGYAKAEQLGQLVGVDVKGTPSSSSYEDVYYDFMVNGNKCRLTLKKLAGSYNNIDLLCL